jgi:endonuclease III related protein
MRKTTKTTRAPSTGPRRRISLTYARLLDAYGPQHWWPAESPFEVCIGAILTQSTSWANVELAIGNLKGAGILSPEGIREANARRLARLIRPSLYYNVKARKLKEFVKFLDEGCGGDVDGMRQAGTQEMRERLLGVWGLGPETVDSILLYALEKPTFVADAYTRRVFSRLGLAAPDASYDELKALFEGCLPPDVGLYNEYHALIVQHGKTFCKSKPACDGCCLKKACANRIR